MCANFKEGVGRQLGGGVGSEDDEEQSFSSSQLANKKVKKDSARSWC
jgi:hypothetical protein